MSTTTAEPKQCFLAGKDAVEDVRTAAQQSYTPVLCVSKRFGDRKVHSADFMHHGPFMLQRQCFKII